MSEFAWVDGALVPLADARVSVLDHGLVVGDGVFETLRVYDGVPFAWRRHLARLQASATGLGLALSDLSSLRAAADDVLAANGLTEARLRITVTGGIAPPGSGRGNGTPTVFLTAFPFAPASPAIDVVVAPWSRNENGALAGLKTISYAANVRALAYAKERGAGEAVFANTKADLCEATGSNVFLVQDGVLVTPPASAGCLLGVTRALVLELCAEVSVPVVERSVPISALADAEEAFLSSTTREVQAIAHVDGRALPAAPGPISARLADAFRALVARTADP
ncbi:MAG TPA: aminotransferase class IV [Acidimicrobiia bacterium]|jgi:branched-chain amino acid aminotransferase|nr:aminotransferase class IV [Acidimicrobiia bacterium]